MNMETAFDLMQSPDAAAETQSPKEAHNAWYKRITGSAEMITERAGEVLPQVMALGVIASQFGTPAVMRELASMAIGGLRSRNR